MKIVLNIVPLGLIIVLVGRLCRKHLHFTTRVFGHSATSPFLGGLSLVEITC